MSRHLFVLGNAYHLCRAELESVFSRFSIIPIAVSQKEPVVDITTQDQLDIDRLNDTLGGTVKIAQHLKTIPDLTAQHIASLIRAQSLSAQEVEFGISLFGDSQQSVFELSASVKERLTGLGINNRYAVPKKDTLLTSALNKNPRFVELIIYEDDFKKWQIGKTVAFQNIDAWNRRDRGRPFSDPKSGMLPLKIARIMVNLALPKGYRSATHLLDPFCGMGSILQEALALGVTAIGSDYLPETVRMARENLTWYESTFSNQESYAHRFTVFESDATHVAQKITPHSIDAIVTEPYLGKVYERKGGLVYQKGKEVTEKDVSDQVKGLEKLYTGALKNWVGLLKSGARVVIIFPLIEFNHHSFSVKKIIDRCEILGYTDTQGPFAYSRPQAVVKRQIYVFTKK